MSESARLSVLDTTLREGEQTPGVCFPAHVRAAIADALWQITKAWQMGQGQTGLYHFSGAPDVSWADFAREVFAQTGRSTRVEDIPSSAYPTPAARPKNSRLSCDKLMMDYGITRPDWRAGLAAMLRDLEESTR